MKIQLDKITLSVISATGVAAGVLGFFTDIRLIQENASSFLLAEMSALLGLAILEFSRLHKAHAEHVDATEKLIVLPSKEIVYRTAVEVLRQSQKETVDRSIWMTSGTAGTLERLIQTKRDSFQLEFDRALGAAILRPGWSARIIYGINDTERLEWVHDLLLTLESADDLEVRAFIRHDVGMLTPLIIGQKDVLIAVGDRRYYRRVRTALHLHGSDANSFMRRYFDLLWQTPDLHVLRSPVGIADETFEQLRVKLSSPLPSERNEHRLP